MKTKIVATAFLSSIILMIHSTEGNAQSFPQYRDFTPERRKVLDEMVKFCDKTIRNNFPARLDTLSYKQFFKCLEKGTGFAELGFILDVNRRKLNKINQRLFRDDIYFFFYAQRLLLPLDESDRDAQYYASDTVPTERGYTQGKPWTRRGLIVNYDGYVRALNESYPSTALLRDLHNSDEISGHGMYHIMTLIPTYREYPKEYFNPEVRELMVVLLWPYICFYGGVDLVYRKCYCESLAEDSKYD